MKKYLVACGALIVAILFSGCGPKSPSVQLTQGAQSLHLNPPPDGYDRLILCRPWRFVNGGCYSAFLVDGTPVVNFRSGSAHINVKSGTHLIAVKLTDYDRDDWGNKLVVDTRTKRQTVALFDGGTGKLAEMAPGFPLAGFALYEPKNSLIKTVHVSDEASVAAVETKREEAKEQAEVVAYKKNITAFIKQKNYAGLKTYVNQNPGASYYIPDYKLRLLFIGPEKFQVGDIINYKKKNMSDLLLAAKIKSVKAPYKQFTMDEIVMLQEYQISDTLIAAMIEVTTEIEKEMARDAKQQKFLDSQRDFALKEPQAASPEKTMTGEIGREVGKQVIKGILDNIF